MTENEKKAKYIAQRMQVKNGVIVNSGTIALVSALQLANIKPGDNVLINGYCCYSLFEAIKNVGANPIIIVPKNFFNITLEEIDSILCHKKIDCFIAAHQFGIVQDIKIIREKYPDLKIIEDIASAWGIIENNDGIGKYSDYVVTSFGKSKPLSYGQAGAVFSNYEIQEYFDFHDRNSRNKPFALLPYALYECNGINEQELVAKADSIIKKQRAIAECLTEYFTDNSNVTIYEDNDEQLSSWQKFPLIIRDKSYIETLEALLNEYHIQYQWQNEKEVWELDMAKNCDCEVIGDINKPLYILIRTRQNDLEQVKRLVKERK